MALHHVRCYRVVSTSQYIPTGSYVICAYALALRLLLRCKSARSMRSEYALTRESVMALALDDFCPLLLPQLLFEYSRR